MKYSFICRSYEILPLSTYFERLCISNLFYNIASFYASLSIQRGPFTHCCVSVAKQSEYSTTLQQRTFPLEQIV